MATDFGSLIKFGAVGAAAYLGYRYFFATPAVMGNAGPGAAAGSGSGSGSGGAGSGSGTAANAFNSIAGIFSRLTARASREALTVASPDQWNVLYISEGGPGPAPDPNEIFGGHDPISLAAYWAGMSAWLSKTKGLSGLAAYAGLYALAGGGRRR